MSEETRDARWHPEHIARVCHEANRALQLVTGDPAPSQPWDCETDDTRRSAVAGVEAALKGVTPEQLHAEWVTWKAAEGWVHGPVKDPDAKTHPCMVPYDQLPPGQRVKDAVFAAIVGAMSGEDQRAADPFGGHEFHYEAHTDLFRCIRCHAYEVTVRDGEDLKPCAGQPPAGSGPIEVNAL